MARDRIDRFVIIPGLCSQTLTPVRSAPLGIHRQLVLQCLPRFISEEPAPGLTDPPAQKSSRAISRFTFRTGPPRGRRAPRRSCSGTRGWIGALQFDLADEGLTDAGHRREARNRHVTRLQRMQARPHEPQVGSLVTKPIHFPRSSPGGALPRLAIFPVVRALVNYFGMLIVHHAIYACRLEKLASHPLRLSTPSA